MPLPVAVQLGDHQHISNLLAVPKADPLAEAAPWGPFRDASALAFRARVPDEPAVHYSYLSRVGGHRLHIDFIINHVRNF